MTAAEDRRRIWDAARYFKVRIKVVLPDRQDHLEACVRADWAAVRACARITPV